MKRRLGNIILAGLVAVSCLGPKVIPRDDMAKIYAEMLLVDQWVKNDRTRSRIADTSYVYGEILSKYGYSIEDYRKSVDKYMDDPERFAMIFEKTEKILNEHIDVLNLEDKLEHTLDSIRTAKRERWFPKVRMPERQALPYINDSLAFEIDSAGMIHISFAVADTMFSGPFMVINDSILRRDSIIRAITDSLLGEKLDSARFDFLLDSLTKVWYPLPDTVLSPRADSVLLHAPDSAHLQAPDSVRSAERDLSRAALDFD